MKTRFLFTFFIISFLSSNAQIVNIPDVNLKAKLLEANASNQIAKDLNGNYFNIDINNDNEIQVSEANQVRQLNLDYFGVDENLWIASLDGIEAFSELISIVIQYSLITDFDYDLPKLINLFIRSAGIESMDLSHCPKLEFLTFIQAIDNQSIQSINLKNGSLLNELVLVNIDNLTYICTDDLEVDTFQSNYPNIEFNSYCSFNPGDDFYIVEGQNKVDANFNNCDVDDYLYPNLKFRISDGTNAGTFISNYSGNHAISVSEGANTFTPILENPSYYSVSPESLTVNFPSEASPYNQDFCITPIGTNNDLEIFIVPITAAIPGFDSEYKIVYRNVGNTALSGTVEFDYSFDSDYMQYLSSIPSEISNTNNILSWDYIDLAPFETREIVVTFNLNTPTDANFPLNSDDELNFEVTISPSLNDETPENNDFGLKQFVVNSFDPNDIRCLEGETILPERVNEYVHYLIRFENLGTANATNIVVKNTIDATKFDINTLVPIDGSHNYYTRINDFNDVEFIFENINLPFDDANNDGYVVFKIKTLDTLVLGDTFSNQAEIYFDFNAPIMTNTYVTEIAEDNLSVLDFNTQNTRVYPNPVNNSIVIDSDVDINSAAIYDINGRLILTKVFEGAEYQINVGMLNSGVYFLKVNSNTQSETVKLVKN